ncbi:MAG TPA: YdcF family protein [Acidobacteriaceae bacterium]|jgi:uncharacterized SAM-binding protein YcdF (DUF218 family)
MKRFLLISILVLIVLSGVCVIGYATVPMGNMPEGPYDAILVLGVPAKRDGTVSEPELVRVREAVGEYRLGRAPRILFSGGPAFNSTVEAHAMAEAAFEMGVPRANLVEEGESLDTLENIENSQRILDAHGWKRVEVISTVPHLHRTAVLLEHTHLQWRGHACHTGETGLRKAGILTEEIVATTMLRVFGLRVIPAMHEVAKAQHAVGRKLHMM